MNGMYDIDSIVKKFDVQFTTSMTLIASLPLMRLFLVDIIYFNRVILLKCLKKLYVTFT